MQRGLSADGLERIAKRGLIVPCNRPTGCFYRTDGLLEHGTKVGRLVALSSFWSDHLVRNELAPANPWKGFSPTGRKQRHRGDDVKRPHTEAELLRIVNGPMIPDNHRTLYPKRTILELYALGEFTGCRLNELCSLTLGDVKKVGKGYTIHVRKSKTEGWTVLHSHRRRAPRVHRGNHHGVTWPTNSAKRTRAFYGPACIVDLGPPTSPTRRKGSLRAVALRSSM